MAQEKKKFNRRLAIFGEEVMTQGVGIGFSAVIFTVIAGGMMHAKIFTALVVALISLIAAAIGAKLNMTAKGSETRLKSWPEFKDGVKKFLGLAKKESEPSTTKTELAQTEGQGTDGKSDFTQEVEEFEKQMIESKARSMQRNAGLLGSMTGTALLLAGLETGNNICLIVGICILALSALSSVAAVAIDSRREPEAPSTTAKHLTISDTDAGPNLPLTGSST